MIEIFFCYAQEDDTLRQELEKHLQALQRQGLITIWHNRNIKAGAEWEREIDKHLNTAQIILLLVSPDFMASDYCYSIEMQRALERHERGEVRVIPVILRPVLWRDTPIGKLESLPTGGTPVVSSTWHDPDEAFYDIVSRLRQVILDLTAPSQPAPGDAMSSPTFVQPRKHKTSPPKTTSDWLQESYRLRKLKRYDKALEACKQLLSLDPANAQGHANLSYILHGLKRYQEALEACNRAQALDPDNARIYVNKANILNELKRYDEALKASDQAIQLDPSNPHPYISKSYALCEFQRFDEALASSKKAIHLDPSHVHAYISASYASIKLGRYREAVTLCDQALQLDPSNIHAQNNKQYALKKAQKIRKNQ